MLYYLGKFDEKKIEYVRLWIEFEKIATRSTSEMDKRLRLCYMFFTNPK
jgi:hypothetical protein